MASQPPNTPSDGGSRAVHEGKLRDEIMKIEANDETSERKPGMSEFRLDTSGEVRGSRLVEGPDGNWRSHWAWPDLSPFEQGYVEAKFASMERAPNGSPILRGTTSKQIGTAHFVGFSDLAPETLAAIRKDCAGLRKRHVIVSGVPEHERAHGRGAWCNRQLGKTPGFPPRTLILSDDGLIRFSDTSGDTYRIGEEG